VDGISQYFFVQRRKDSSRQRHFDYVVIFIGSRDICAQTLQNFTKFFFFNAELTVFDNAV